MDQKQLQAEVNDQIALTLGRQMVELIIAQATIAAMEKALGTAQIDALAPRFQQPQQAPAPPMQKDTAA
jgi:hypothetical protein